MKIFSDRWWNSPVFLQMMSHVLKSTQKFPTCPQSGTKRGGSWKALKQSYQILKYDEKS